MWTCPGDGDPPLRGEKPSHRFWVGASDDEGIVPFSFAHEDVATIENVEASKNASRGLKHEVGSGLQLLELDLEQRARARVGGPWSAER